MSIKLREFEPEDLPKLEHWAANIQSDEYMSRVKPKNPLSNSHDPKNGLFWYVIIDSNIEVGTIWLEPSECFSESILGILLNSSNNFGKGIGSQAINLAIKNLLSIFPGNIVTLNVRQNNVRGIACYKKVGFSIVMSGSKTWPSGEQVHYFKMQLKSGFIQKREE